MRDTFDLVKQLDKTGYRQIRREVKRYSNGREGRLLRLLDHLYSANTCPTRPEAQKMVYGKDPASGFRLIKSKLKKRVLEYLAKDRFTVELGKNDPLYKAEIRIRRKMLQVHVLLVTRYNPQTMYNLLQEVEEQAARYELYDVVRDACHYKKYIGFCKDWKDFDKLNDQVSKASFAEDAVARGRDLYYQLISWNTFLGKLNQEKVRQFLRSGSKELHELFRKTGSLKVYFFYKMLELASYTNDDEYLKARAVLTELIPVVKNNRQIYVKGRLNSLGSNLSRIELYLGNFEEAIRIIDPVIEDNIPGSYNYYISLEQKFFCQFYGKYLPDARETLQELLIGSGDITYRHSQFLYYQANLNFLEGKYKDALRILGQPVEIARDRQGYALGVKMLRIMILIELNSTETAMAEIESLRKHMDRHALAELNQREKLILRLLKSLDKYGFDFSRLGVTGEKILKSLADPSGSFKWEFISAEMIPFHEWVLNKRGPAGRGYRRIAPSYSSRFSGI